MDRDIIFTKEVDALYRAILIPLTATSVNAIILSIILYRHVATPILLLWLAVNTLLIFYRYWTYKRFSRHRLTPYQAYRSYFITTVASGLLWGSSAFYFFPLSDVYLIIVVLIIGGMAAGAVGSSSYRPEIYFSYNLSVLSPYAFIFFSRPGEMYLMLGFTIILFSAMLIFSSKRFHSNFVATIDSKLEIELLLSELQNALEEAQSAAKAKDAFFASMSHELRTPLNAIIGFSQILTRKSDLPPRTAEYVEKILLSGQHLLNLVNTILDFSKMKAGKMDLSLKPVLLKQLFSNLSAIIEPIAQKKNITVRFPEQDPLAYAVADSQMLFQILLNLLTNAVKFSSEESSVTVHYSGIEEHLFCVEDQGVGIDTQNLELIFDPFSQVPTENFAASVKGTGLGLAIVKEMVEAHGGRIWVESSLHEGSRFYFSIPLLQTDNS